MIDGLIRFFPPPISLFVCLLCVCVALALDASGLVWRARLAICLWLAEQVGTWLLRKGQKLATLLGHIPLARMAAAGKDLGCPLPPSFLLSLCVMYE
jgi:hypothetical protein